MVETTIIDLSPNRSVSAIRNEMVQDLLRKNPKMTKKTADDIAKRTTPYLECPATHNRVSPITCQFCPTGHMTECHFPHSCEEAQCSHLQPELLEIDQELDE